MKPEPSPEIVDYIRANRGTYTREAIERELREAGHSQEAIDAAWASFPVEVAAEPPPSSVINAAQFWVLMLVVACLALTILPYASFFISSLFNSFLAQRSGTYTNSGAVYIVAFVLPLLLGYLLIGLGAWWLRRRDRAAAFGILSGLVVAFVFSVIVAGTCAAIIAQL